MIPSRHALAISVFCASSIPALRAQCPSWSTSFCEPGPNEGVFGMHVFDDGSGPALYVGGDFTYVGEVAAKRIAKWDGASWSPLGEGLSKVVNTIADFDAGRGAELYAGGGFLYSGATALFGVARWDGSAWQPLGGGTDGSVTDLLVFDDGSGPALFVSGGFDYVFDDSGPIYSRGVARWNGSSWSSVGGGSGIDASSLAVFDDGSGAALYAAGQGGSSSLMKWNGATWTPVYSPLTGPGHVLIALAEHDDGTGSALYAAGDFDTIAGVAANDVAKWDGTSWSALGAGITGNEVETLASLDLGSGRKLYAGGWFTHAGGASAPNLASWDGASWSGVGGGAQATVEELCAFDSGGAPELWVGGTFASVGSVAALHLAHWDGAAWSAAAPGAGMHVEGTSRIDALAEIDDGTGPALYAVGYFKHLGLAIADSVARWDGTSWTSLASVNQVTSAIAGYDDGNGPALYMATSYFSPTTFSGVDRWDGSSWTHVGLVTSSTGGFGSARELLVFDDGSGAALYVGGGFGYVDGVVANSIARWNGTSWSGFGYGVQGVVEAMTVFDDGSGPALYVGGHLVTAGLTTPVNGVAKWNGSSWSALGDGLNGGVLALAVHDDGSGPALYAAGEFSTSATTLVNRIARWNGASWTPLGSGMNDHVRALASYDDGFGASLFAAGRFTTAGGASAKRVAKWSGSSWSALADGLGPSVCNALAIFHDGVAPQGSLYAGGDFRLADGAPSTGIARWTNPCACSGTSYCTSGVTSNGCVPTISGTGTASASASSGFTISIASVEGQKQGHVFYGINGPNAAPWGASSHYLCVKAPTQRTGTQDSGGTAGACNGSIALDWNAYCATHPGALGVPFSAGQSVWAQLYFRDPPGPKTTALSNALTFSVCP